MKRKSSKSYIPWGLLLILIIFLIFISTPFVFTQEPGEEVQKGSYSLKRIPAPDYLVTGVRLSELSEATFGKISKVDTGLSGKWGRSFTLFQKEDKKQIRITVAVYPSVTEAENSVLELLNEASVIMKPGSRSGGIIGTHSWYLISPSGSGTIVFTYYNSLFQLFSSDYGFAERSAQSIVNDLGRGINGILLGKKVLSPILTDVEIPSKVVKGEQVPLLLKARDPSLQKLSFVVSASRGRLLETKTHEERMYIPAEAGSDELRAYAVNEANVISELFVKKVEVEKER